MKTNIHTNICAYEGIQRALMHRSRAAARHGVPGQLPQASTGHVSSKSHKQVSQQATHLLQELLAAGDEVQARLLPRPAPWGAGMWRSPPDFACSLQNCV